MIYDYVITTGKGDKLNLNDYRGRVIMIVNTATGCGFTVSVYATRVIHFSKTTL